MNTNEGMEAQTTDTDQKKSFVSTLDEGGVLDFISEALVQMYTQPKAPPELLAGFLATCGITDPIDVEKLINENQELRKRITELKAQVAELQAKVRK